MNDVLPRQYFSRMDESDDERFYSAPRRVVHIDEGAIQAVGALFGELLPPDGEYLDLMSSWRSHLPAGLKPRRVVGLGMNAPEMADNPQLTEHIVHNLNRRAALPFGDNTFDAALCTVSVQYLTQPVEVFREVRRVLRPGGVFVVTFSNRCFPTKAVSVWLNSGDQGHVALVRRYFEAAGGWNDVTARQQPTPRKLFGGGDPLYGVWAFKAYPG